MGGRGAGLTAAAPLGWDRRVGVGDRRAGVGDDADAVGADLGSDGGAPLPGGPAAGCVLGPPLGLDGGPFSGAARPPAAVSESEFCPSTVERLVLGAGRVGTADTGRARGFRDPFGRLDTVSARRRSAGFGVVLAVAAPAVAVAPAFLALAFAAALAASLALPEPDAMVLDRGLLGAARFGGGRDGLGGFRLGGAPYTTDKGAAHRTWGRRGGGG